MIKTKYIMGAALVALAFASCSEDQMDHINTDEQHSSISIVDGNYSITDAEVNTVYNILDGNYAWYVSSYTEQLFGTGNNQLKNAELRNVNEVASSTTFNNEWNNTYANLYNLKVIKEKCRGGVNNGADDLLGMAQALEALNWGILTDLHGDVPCTEALGGQSTPALTSQKDIYDKIFSLLDSAQTNLAQGSKTVGTHDVIFNGNLDKWAGLVHALKARYLLHTYGTDKTPAHLNKVLAEAEAAVSAGFDGANLDVFNGKTSDNSWSAYHWSRYYIGSSKTVEDLLTARKDPREPIYNFDGFETEAGVGTPGNAEQAQSTNTLAYPAWLENSASSLHLFSKSELYFIIAEVKARLGQDAKSDFDSAVRAAMDDWGTAADSKISAADVDAYLNGLADRYAANPLNEILTQKYIAQTRDEQLETYNDIRRCDYVDGSYPVKMQNPNNISGSSNRWPLRLPYGDSDVTSNPNVAKVFGSGNEAGMYIYTNPVWWAGGNN